ncbi:hypothetical protein HYH02_008300 [Chlamydomonas schloesseri]|uniref:30S ribosomal protein 3, chloroplastic n=1 Tax=Chlamydomonas schloesseri TaxID=2026947 RepID=A0A836B459_9CHLO|nr:hypothetical protein HYH02_008300 [Chlamydomonas schloesseri]|eukprot:KAG2446739.1 hypothetical protein HYH02_008300 [Chlamydomonas schloesseri]
MMLVRQVPCLAQRASARSAVRSRPAPFTPARRVFARAQADAALLEDDEVAYEVTNDDFELDENDPDLLAGLEAVELLGSDVDAMTAAAVAAEMEAAEDKEEAARAVEDVMASKLAAGELSEAELSKVAAAVGDLEGAELDDFVPALASDRYTEAAVSADDKALMEPLKLSKGELRNLLPQDWDQINVDFFSNKKDENIPLPEYRLNVLWTDKNLAVAIDQVYSRGQVSPLTEYYFWPRQDAWEELRINLESRPWISERDRIILLNRLTQLINFWQDEEVKRTVEEARAEFPDCAFAIA